MKSLIPTFILPALVLSALLCGCSSGTVAGGGSDHPNSLTGIARLPLAAGSIVGAQVILVAGSYAEDSLEMLLPLASSRLLDTALCDSSGRFVFNGLANGAYYCYVMDASGNYVGRSSGVAESLVSGTSSDTLALADTVGLEPAAFIAGTALQKVQTSCRLYLPGTPFAAALSASADSWRIGPIPAGAYRVLGDINIEALRDTVVIMGVTLAAGDTVRGDSLVAESKNLLLWDFETVTKYNELRGILYDPDTMVLAGRMLSSVDSLAGGNSRLLPGNFDADPEASFVFDAERNSTVMTLQMHLGGPFDDAGVQTPAYCSVGFMIAGTDVDLSAMDSISFDIKASGGIRFELNTLDSAALGDSLNRRNGNYLSDTLFFYTGSPWQHISIPVSQFKTDTLSRAWQKGLRWGDFSQHVFMLVLHALQNTDLSIDNLRLCGIRASELRISR